MKNALLTLLLVALATTASASAAPAKIVDLRVESQSNPSAVNSPLPRFSWRIEADERGWLQKSYHILVASSPELLAEEKGDLWDSGEVISRLSHFIAFKGAPLRTGQRAFWKVRVTSSDGTPLEWSPNGEFTTALSGAGAEPQDLFKEDSPALSSFESSDPRLNELFAAAGRKAHEITSLTDLGFALRGASFHKSPFPGASGWFKQLNNATDLAGFYPASVHPDGTFGSLQSDAAISSGHALWWMSGDSSLFQLHIGSMKNHVLARSSYDLEKTGLPFGKLPAGLLPEGDPTDPAFIHFASQVLNLRLISDMGRLSSRDPYDLFIVQKLQQSYMEAFQKNFADEAGLLRNHSLASLLFSIRCGLYDTEAKRKAAYAALLRLSESADPKEVLQQSPLISQSLLPTLTWLGKTDRALQIAKAQDPETASPVVLANTSEWLISMLAGIDTDGPGFQKLRIQPQIPAGDLLSHAKAHYDGPNGRIAVSWKKEGTKLLADITIPPNSSASITLPLAAGQTVKEKGLPVKTTKGFFNYQESGASVTFNCGSGSYSLVVE